MHPYDHPLVVAGQGTMARELDAQAPGIDTVLVAVGGGGLIAGVAAWFGDRVRIVSVEPATDPGDVRGAAGGPPGRGRRSVAWPPTRSAPTPSVPCRSPRAAPFVDDAVLVTDDAIRDAQRALWASVRLLAEPGGAAALAAVRSGAYRPEPGERVVVVVCGSNVDPQTSPVDAAASPTRSRSPGCRIRTA